MALEGALGKHGANQAYRLITGRSGFPRTLRSKMFESTVLGIIRIGQKAKIIAWIYITLQNH